MRTGEAKKDSIALLESGGLLAVAKEILRAHGIRTTNQWLEPTSKVPGASKWFSA
jgi:hypothetical protein